MLGLWIGYYSGALAALRSAFEALEYAALFHSEPRYAATWLKTEFLVISRKKPGDLRTDLRDLEDRARGSLNGVVTVPRELRAAVKGFWRSANDNIHATVWGLSEEFEAAIEAFIPDSLTDSTDDVEKAFDLWALESMYG